MQNLTKRLGIWAAVVALLMLIPLTLQLTIGTGVDGQGFNWKLNDFVIIAILLFSTACVYEFIVKRIPSTNRRAVAIVVLVLALLYVWAELAVGILNIPGISGS